MSRGRVFAGTSGFAYKQWKPGFYPADLKNTDMLRYYAGRLPSVEINNTFYRTPTASLLESWKAQTPETFRFTLKAPQRITHVKRLHDVADSVEYFLGAARILDTRLGCILFQCPPSLPYRRELLEEFLALLPDGEMRFAMEFRHPSWSVDEVRERLATKDVTWCSVDDEEAKAPVIRTAKGFVYLRLRNRVYDEAALESWSAALRPVLEEGADVYVYFKHEDDPSGVRYAERLIALTS